MSRAIVRRLFALGLLLPSVLVGAEREPRPGTFLVARKGLPDPNFTRSVVLVVEYGAEGASGLIVNRRTKIELGEVLPDVPDLAARGAHLYEGGPVSRNMMTLLLRAPQQHPDSLHVFDDVRLSRSLDALRALARDDSAVYRVYGGYAGWSPGQLDHELARGDWHVVPASAELVFAAEPLGLWDRLLPKDPNEWAHGPRLQRDRPARPSHVAPPAAAAGDSPAGP